MPPVRFSKRFLLIVVMSVGATVVSCSDWLSSPSAKKPAASYSSGIMTSVTTTTTAAGRSIVTRTQAYSISGSSRPTVTPGGDAQTVDSAWVPVVNVLARRALLSASAQGQQGNARKPLQARRIAAKIKDGKRYELTFADTAGHSRKDPPHLVVLTVDGVVSTAVLPTFKRVGNKWMITGGTIVLYDESGKPKQASRVTFSDDMVVGSSRRNGMVDVLARYADTYLLPARLGAQGGCADDLSMNLLDTVLLFGETGPLDLLVFGADIWQLLDCASEGSGVVVLPPVVVTCPACYDLDLGYTMTFWDVWGTPYEAEAMEWYCPPC